MPPKKPVTGGAKTTTSKPASKGATGKTTTTAPKTTAAKGAATKGAVSKPAQKEPEKKEVKKTLPPETIALKAIANVLAYSGDVGMKMKESKRWPFIIDRTSNANVGVFLKYRDTNLIGADIPVDYQPEPLRKAMIGSLFYGKPLVINIGVEGKDQDKLLEQLKSMCEELYAGLWSDLMDQSIIDVANEKCLKLVKPNDPEEYNKDYNYKSDQFLFVILTTATVPPATANEDFFPIIVE